MMQHQTFTRQKSFECEVSSKNFETKDSLCKHIKDHPKKEVICKICYKRFRTKDSERYLKKHMKIHSAIHLKKQYKCETCSMKFAHPHSLQLHERIHTGEKPYVCEICQRAFRCSTGLRSHCRVHTGEKPYVCEICNSSFSKKLSLNNHYQTHTQENLSKFGLDGKHSAHEIGINPDLADAEKKLYTCEICDKNFKRGCDLKSHKYFHDKTQKVIVRNESETGHSPNDTNEIINYSELMQKNFNTYERQHKNIAKD